jgi:hypothetical protein
MQYLTASISDAVKKTGIDGFMIDWLWMPNRKATEGKLLQPSPSLAVRDLESSKIDFFHSKESHNPLIINKSNGQKPKCSAIILIWLLHNSRSRDHSARHVHSSDANST